MAVLIKDVLDTFIKKGFVVNRVASKNIELKYGDTQHYIYIYNSGEKLRDKSVQSTTPLSFVGLHPQYFDKKQVNEINGVVVNLENPYRKGANMRYFPTMEGGSHYGLRVNVDSLDGLESLIAYIVAHIEGGSSRDISDMSGATESLNAMEIDQQELAILQSIEHSEDLSTTEKEILRTSRIGQGVYRQRVLQVEKSCRLTGVADERFLVASHIKSWRDSNNDERLDAENGLMLSPHVDKLFDQGYISFTDEGKLLVSKLLDVDILNLWAINPHVITPQPLTKKQAEYMAYHRKHIFRH